MELIGLGNILPMFVCTLLLNGGGGVESNNLSFLCSCMRAIVWLLI